MAHDAFTPRRTLAVSLAVLAAVLTIFSGSALAVQKEAPPPVPGSSAVPTATGSGLVLSVPSKIQEQTNWCWAGTSQAVLSYYGTEISQCLIANYAWSLATCCEAPANSTTCNQYNTMWGNTGSLQDILSHWGVASTPVSSALTEDTARSEINSGRPFLMRWAWTAGGAHFLVGIGLNPCSMVTYLDPNSGFNTDTYASVASNTDHTWTHSLQVSTKPTSIFSFKGYFTVDNEVQRFKFTVGNASTVVLKTTSYAGGPNTAGQPVARGGLDTILAVFDSAGALIATNDDGGACNVPADSVTGEYYDTLLKVALQPGNYTVTVMQYNNWARGPNLSNGFTHDGAADNNFTKTWSGGNPGLFYDVTGNKRDGHWSFDVYSASKATSIINVKVLPAVPLLLKPQ